MSTEKLIVEVDARVKQAEQDIKGLKEEVGGLKQKTDETDRSLRKFVKNTKKAGETVSKYAKRIAAAGVALTTYVTIAAKAEQDTKRLADTAKTTTEDFKGLAFAFSQVGVDAKGTADAMNDVSERLGEFSAAASGPFQDFADVMGLTTEEAQALAQTLQQESPEDAIRFMVDAMEDANVEGAQMSFVLKSMSNDLEYANKLFRDNGAELDRLKNKYGELEEQLGLTSDQAQGLQKAAEEFGLVTKAVKLGATAIASELAPEFIRFFEYVTESVPEATQAVIDFINSWRDPENVRNVASLQEFIKEGEEEIARLRQELFSEENKRSEEFSKIIVRDIKAVETKTQAYRDQLEAILALREGEEGDEDETDGNSTGLTGGGVGEDLFLEQLAAEFEKMAEYETEYQAMREEKHAEHIQRMIDQSDVFVDALLEDFKAMDEAEETLQKNKEKAINDGFKAARAVGDLLFEDNKAIQSGLIVADTARNVVTSVANSGGVPFGIPAGIAAAALGLKQLQALNSTKKGAKTISGAGGGTVGGTTSGGDSSTAQPGPVYYLQGVESGMQYDGEQIIEVVNEAQKNGARLMFL